PQGSMRRADPWGLFPFGGWVFSGPGPFLPLSEPMAVPGRDFLLGGALAHGHGCAPEGTTPRQAYRCGPVISGRAPGGSGGRCGFRSACWACSRSCLMGSDASGLDRWLRWAFRYQSKRSLIASMVLGELVPTPRLTEWSRAGRWLSASVRTALRT